MKLKGYKTANGSYITKKEQEHYHKKYIKELKELRKQKQIELQKEEEYKLALYLQEKKEIEEEKARMQQLRELKIDFMNNKIIKLNLSQKQFIIVYDLMNYNTYQIISDYNRGRITSEDIAIALKAIPAELIEDQYLEAITELQ